MGKLIDFLRRKRKDKMEQLDSIDENQCNLIGDIEKRMERMEEVIEEYGGRSALEKLQIYRIVFKRLEGLSGKVLKVDKVSELEEYITYMLNDDNCKLLESDDDYEDIDSVLQAEFHSDFELLDIEELGENSLATYVFFKEELGDRILKALEEGRLFISID